MEIEYESSVEKKYMILNRIYTMEDAFDEKMYLKANIPFLIKADIRYINNDEKYYYDINNKISINEKFREKTINAESLLVILEGIYRVINIISEYLLHGESLLLSPEYVYLNDAEDMIFFCYYPGYKNEINNSFSEMAIFLMDKIDHDNDLCNQIVYEYYENVCKEIYSTEKYIDMIKNSLTDDAQLQEYIDISSEENEEEERKFYFSEPEIEETLDDNREIILPLIICVSIILISAAIYIFIFLNQNILTFLGISPDKYIVGGAAMAFLLSIVIYFVIKIHIKKSEKLELEQVAIEEENYQKRMTPGIMEKREYELKKNK